MRFRDYKQMAGYFLVLWEGPDTNGIQQRTWTNLDMAEADARWLRSQGMTAYVAGVKGER